METQLGAIAGMLGSEEGVETPLQRRMADLGKKLALLCIGVCVLVFVAGIAYGNDAGEMFMTAISLAVAAIPEGLLAIVTIVLAIGVQQMIAQNAIIRRLPAVEALGSATVICSDKTGTLTMNRMTVTALCEPFAVVDAAENSPSAPLMNAMGLCNDAVPAQNEQGETVLAGDPTETALLACANRWGFDGPAAQTATPRVDELPFDSDVKRMATVHRLAQDRYVIYVKGGLDEVLALCTNIREGETVRSLTEEDQSRIQASAADMSSNALRVLAFATGETGRACRPQVTRRPPTKAGPDLSGHGRHDRPAAPHRARGRGSRAASAGIKPVMITGDHRLTACRHRQGSGHSGKGDRAVTGAGAGPAWTMSVCARRCANIAVYARVSPEHKVRIVKAWQKLGRCGRHDR